MKLIRQKYKIEVSELKPITKEVTCLEIAQAKYIIRVLRHFKWNQLRAARALNISARTLRFFIREQRRLGTEIPSYERNKKKCEKK